MSSPFSRTWRSLETDTIGGWRVGIVLAVLLLAAWGVWMATAEVPLFAVTERCRLEGDQPPHRLQAPDVSGRLAALSMTLGQEVRRGQVLARIESEVASSQLSAEEARRRGLEEELRNVLQQVRSMEAARGDAGVASEAALAEARARLDEALASLRLAEEEAARFENLHRAGHVSRTEHERAAADAESKRAAVEALRGHVGRLAGEARTGQRDRVADLDELRAKLSRLQGELDQAAASVRRYAETLRLHEIVAPLDGRIGEMASLHAGAYVRPGEWIATIVPRGTVRVVASFPERDAGVLSRGQRARVRLDAYPWLEYGSVMADVEQVATEPREGWIRVEMRLSGEAPQGVDLVHGLTGQVEVEVRRMSPIELLLRAAGKRAS